VSAPFGRCEKVYRIRIGRASTPLSEKENGIFGLLASNARRAIENGQSAAAALSDRVALEPSNMLTGVDIAYLLHRDAKLLERIRRIVRERLGCPS
jgi:hypothetical protein